MKQLKRMLALVLAIALALAIAVPAFADENGPEIVIDMGNNGGKVTVKLPEKPENADNDELYAAIRQHTFMAYQIFEATYADYAASYTERETIGYGDVPIIVRDPNMAGDKSYLIAFKWGNGIDPEKLWNALLKDDNFKDKLKSIQFTQNTPGQLFNPSAYELAKIMSELQSDQLKDGEWVSSAGARAFAAIADQCLIDGKGIKKDDPIPAGYYLVVDSSNNGEMKNLSVLAMSGDNQFFQPEVKVDAPEMDKKVLEIDDSTGSFEWKDVADYDIGDHIPFVLTGSLPSDYSSYEYYRYVFHDTLSPTLSFNNDVTVYINGKVLVNDTNNEWYKVEQTSDSFTVTIKDLKVLPASYGIDADSTIQVVYTARLLPNAVLGNPSIVDGKINGNTNTAYLEFSNDPNYHPDPNRDPDDPDDPDDPPPTGDTPPKTVIVLTFKVVVNKISDQKDEEGKPVRLPGADFTLFKYYPDESKLPQAVRDLMATNEQVTVNGKTYYAVPADLSEVTDSEEETPAEPETQAETTDTKEGPTQFVFKGLDAGDYMLRETVVPDGYNRAEDMFFTIISTLDDATQKATGLGIKDGIVKDENGNTILNMAEAADPEDGALPTLGFVSDLNAGSLTTSIVNLTGVLLPSTGGIGTTIFYVIGGLLVLAAVVLLITKKRMGNQDKPE